MLNRRTVELGRMTWAEIDEAVAERPIILLPIGTVEQHGPHLPVNADNMVAAFVALRVAERTNALVAPSVNYGCSAPFRHFPGTLTVRQETLANVLRDVCTGLIGHGFRRIIFVNNHGGNEAVCEQVARELRQQHGTILGNIYPWIIGYGVMRDAYPDAAAVYGHGGEPETSAMLAMYPEDVLRDRQVSGKYQPFAGWRVQTYNSVVVPGQAHPATLYLDSREVAPTGVTGDNSAASAALGQLWIERVVGFAVAFVQHYDAVTADADWAR